MSKVRKATDLRQESGELVEQMKAMSSVVNARNDVRSEDEARSGFTPEEETLCFFLFSDLTLFFRPNT